MQNEDIQTEIQIEQDGEDMIKQMQRAEVLDQFNENGLRNLPYQMSSKMGFQETDSLENLELEED